MPGTVAVQQQLDAAKQQRAADFTDLLEAVSQSQTFVPVGKTLTQKQIRAMTSQPSPHVGGLAGATTASKPRHAAARREVKDPYSGYRLGTSHSAAGMSTGPSAGAYAASTGLCGTSLPSRGGTPHMRSRAEQYGSMGEYRPMDDFEGSPRSRSLVHLDVLPPSLSRPRIHMSALGATVAPSGLGARGDAELGEEEEALLVKDLEREEAKRVVAPRRVEAPGSLTASFCGDNMMASTASESKLVKSASTSSMFYMPSAYQGGSKAAMHLNGLVPPEANDALMRVRAEERRKERHGSNASMAIKMSPAPAKYSSIASRLASPMEFLHSSFSGAPGAALLPSSSMAAKPSYPYNHHQASTHRQVPLSSQSLGTPYAGALLGNAATPFFSSAQTPGVEDTTFRGPGGPVGQRAPPPSREASRPTAALLEAAAATSADASATPLWPPPVSKSRGGGGLSVSGSSTAGGPTLGGELPMREAAFGLGSPLGGGGGDGGLSTIRSGAAFGTAKLAHAASAPALPPRSSRAWVTTQARLDAHFAAEQKALESVYSSAASITGQPELGAVSMPWREDVDDSRGGPLVANFMRGKPQPAAPKSRASQAHGVPWKKS